ncbi:tRNA 2'-phosphotransferase [Trichomonascus vanleenenianus]|uniref:tRNA 2'-phosphotransferase n=1 Tax=Trichomonascus vanleenenianus TaxID=2268995 RepID=UPI003ECB4E04
MSSQQNSINSDGKKRVRKGGGRPNDSPDVKLSKGLSYILRHGAKKEGIAIGEDGYVAVNDLLNNPRFKGVTFDQISHIVDTNDKKRFALMERLNEETNMPLWYIRANQGHSVKVDVEMKPLKKVEDFPKAVVHGTYTNKWELIKQAGGLSRMKRNHIHFAAGKPGEDGVISGSRASSNLFIYIDVEKALAKGIEFFLSENGVILTAGDANGLIPIDLFAKVEDRKGVAYM